ncbi:MAG: lipoate protein ligase C-terminal domain-containing protein [Candidatus Ranarchaeia archaeon]
MGKAQLKVPGGKLLRAMVVMDHSARRINKVVITGDFFLHPEEILPEMETALIGKPLDRTVLTSTISKILKDNDAVIVGAQPEDFASLLILAAESHDDAEYQ